MSARAIECTGVTKRFDDTVAVDSASFSLERGKLMCLLGPSGCGKTTMLRLIAGFETADAGAISVGGRIVAGPGVNLPPNRRRVGMVFQDYALFPHMDLAANVAYAMPGGNGRAGGVDSLLELVGLSDLRGRLPHELSGGEQQRAALARSLAAEPEVILLDEPFSNLDAALRGQLREQVREILLAAGVTAIFVTHDLEEALSFGDSVAVMFDGRIIQIDSPEELYRRPATRRIAEWLGEANFIPGAAEGVRVSCELGNLDLVSPVTGDVDVMLRPEWITLQTDPSADAVVQERVFYGHDQMVRVKLRSGVELRVRVWSPDRFVRGERVRVRPLGFGVAYERDGGRRS